MLVYNLECKSLVIAGFIALGVVSAIFIGLGLYLMFDAMITANGSLAFSIHSLKADYASSVELLVGALIFVVGGFILAVGSDVILKG